MPSARRLPPAPVETDGVRVLVIGTVLWALALCAMLLLRDRLRMDGREDWVWTCLTGTVLGLVGIAYCARRRNALRRSTSRPVLAPAAPAAPPPQPGPGGGRDA